MDDDEQINIAGPTSGQMAEEDYRPSDVEQIFKDAHPDSWDSLINFIREKGDTQWHITPGEAKAMTEDAEKAKNSGPKFLSDPYQIYSEMHKFREQSEGKEEGEEEYGEEK